MMRAALILSALALATGASTRPAFAAHAGAPYKNVNHKNDAGNDTGDSKVDQLNAAQLNSNYQGSNPPPASGMTPPH